MWNDTNRDELLGNNKDFLEKYCIERTKAVLREHGVFNKDDFISEFREVVQKLTKLMPNMAHATPWEKQKPEETPLLFVGRCEADGDINPKIIGLCIIGKSANAEIHLILGDKNVPENQRISEDDDSNQIGWKRWTNSLWYFTRDVEAGLEKLKEYLEKENIISNDWNKNHKFTPKDVEELRKQKEEQRKKNKHNSDDNSSEKTDTQISGTKMPALNTILYGPPGTGKTFNTINEALKIIDSEFFDPNKDNREELKKRFDELVDAKQIRFVTFHQSYSYEEFVEGIRADTKGKDINYFVKPGIFKEICKDAKDDPNENYVLIIDEINRGNISKIFGELITLIEESKRAGNKEALMVTLPYSPEEQFAVPKNLYIIGTMNTADRSLALMDTALRRRFDFIEMMPKPELLEGVEVESVKIKEMLETINQRIEVLYDREHTLGHAFFMSLTNASTIDDLAAIFKNKIIPLLQEYFFEDWEKVRIVLGDDTKENLNQFIHENSNNLANFSDAVKTNPKYRLLNDVKSYSLNYGKDGHSGALVNSEAYIGIYQKIVKE
jgi:hypothetical protein